MTGANLGMRPGTTGKFMFCLIVGYCTTPGPCVAETGTWVADNNFGQVTMACTRTYTCRPPIDIVYDARLQLVSTPPALVWGVCSAGSGPNDSCNDCLTNPPETPCEWHLEGDVGP